MEIDKEAMVERCQYMEYNKMGSDKLPVKTYISMWRKEKPSITKKWKAFPFETPEDKIADMMHDGYSFNDALKHTKKAFKKLSYTIKKDEEEYLRKAFRSVKDGKEK